MTQTCNKCKAIKNINKENFIPCIRMTSGFEHICRICRNNQARINRFQKYHHNPKFKRYLLNLNKKSNQKCAQIKTQGYLNKIESGKRWKLENKERVAELDILRHKRRWANPNYRLSKNFSNKVNLLIRDKNNTHIFDLLGYSIEDLKLHIEKQFQEGMSWDNYGKWHIDHIRPICSFKYDSNNDPEFKACWALSNLRPLWAKYNYQKSHEDKKLSIRHLL